MKIIFLCGSPKGEVSITMQYLKFLQLKFPDNEFEYIQAARKIHLFERNTQAFSEVMEKIRQADLVIWSFPLYILNVHGNYKRFIELIFERKMEICFEGKYAAALSTSINFYDNAAHNYINAICDDLGMKYLDSFAAHMGSLEKEEGRKKLIGFGKYLLYCVESGVQPAKRYEKIGSSGGEYIPAAVEKYNLADNRGKKVVILADAHYKNLDGMIERFSGSFISGVDKYYISDIDIKGGCRGCLRCGADNNCFYDGKDGFREFYSSKIRTADILVFAGKIKDRYLSSIWKTFFDRMFFNTHQVTLAGKQVGFLISGPLGRINDLKEVLSTWLEFQESNIVDFVTDEYIKTDNDIEGQRELDRQITGLAGRLVKSLEFSYVKPKTFRSIGGMKIFRDEIYAGLKVIFKADHRNYKRTGVYDFPHKKPFSLLFFGIAYWITSLSFIKKKMYENMAPFMIRRYAHLFNEKIKGKAAALTGK